MNQEHKETYAEYVNREPVESPKTECEHIWVNKAGSTYRAYPVEVCIKCYTEHTRSATRTCTHYGVDLNGSDYYGTSNPPQETDWNYNYCPFCGADLQEKDKL